MPSARPCPLATTRATMNAVSQHLRVHHGRALLLGRLLRHTAARRRLSASVAPAEVSGVHNLLLQSGMWPQSSHGSSDRECVGCLLRKPPRCLLL